LAGPADYCTPDDIQLRLPNASEGEEATNWSDYIHSASRAIDRFCKRYFYPDGTGLKYFDVEGDPYTGRDTWPPNGARGGKMLFLDKHDFYNLTALKVAQIENGNPNSPTDWITLTGDGITPPTDFFLEPSNQTYVGKFGDTNKKPFWWVQLPSFGPLISSTFRGYFTSGKRTVSINANWGWPAIPDEIRDICIKIVIRMAASSGTGYTGQVGSPEYGAAIVTKYLDVNDLYTLSDYKKTTIDG
jgi:hypothetical protein